MGFTTSCLGESCGAESQETPTEDQLADPFFLTLPVVENTESGHDEDLEEEASSRVTANRSGRNLKMGASQSQTAGRKWAAKLFPLDREAPCEWKGQANVGGGDYPILGCVEGTQQARHHGPDKSVHNNEVGNVHRICHWCHIKWHTANDPSYDWNAGFYPPHNPRPFEHNELQQQLLAYMKYQSTRRKDEPVREMD